MHLVDRKDSASPRVVSGWSKFLGLRLHLQPTDTPTAVTSSVLFPIKCRNDPYNFAVVTKTRKTTHIFAQT